MRKTKLVQITEGGSVEANRDYGKHFLLTEMASRPAEKWAARVFQALGRANVEIPPEVAVAGFIGLVFMGIKMLSSMRYDDYESLMDEMMQCIKIIPDMARPEVIRPIRDTGSEGDDIEEIGTRLRLREELFTLHAGFTPADAVSKLALMAPAMSTEQSTTQTSNQPSD